MLVKIQINQTLICNQDRKAIQLLPIFVDITLTMKLYLVLFFFLFIFYSCKKDSTPSANNTSVNDTTAYSISAQINGVNWGTDNISVIKDTLIRGLQSIIGDSLGRIELDVYSYPSFNVDSYNFRPANVDSSFVSLSSLSAAPYLSGVKINWITESEDNLSSFNIERSTDGVNFNMIGNVKAIGNSTSPISYLLLSLTNEKHNRGICLFGCFKSCFIKYNRRFL